MLNSTSYADRFNVVDIDPYGTASPFLDSAVQCLYDGGLLCVTCTDMAVLCGATPGTAYGKYGGVAIKMTAQHEQGLRLLLHAIQQAASRHGKVIEPLLSLSIDFYARIFVRVWTSPGRVKRVASKMALVYSCTGCHTFHLQRLGNALEGGQAFSPARGPPVGPLCPECGSPFAVAGPLWADSLHNVPFLHDLIDSLRKLKPAAKTAAPAEALEMVDFSSEFELPEWLSLAPNLRTCLPAVTFGTLNRLIGMLTVASEELEDCPFYMQIDQLASIIRTSPPKMTDLRSAFLNAGYRVSLSHAATASLKTDAPASFIWDVMCAWKRQVEASKEKVTDEPPGSGSPYLQKEDEMNMSLEDSETDETMRAKQRIVDGTTEIVKTQKAVKRKYQSKKHPPPEAALRVEATLMARPHNPRVDFSRHPNANPSSREEGLLRYQVNPLPNWGPKPRARSVKKPALKEPTNPAPTKQP
nr:unnamed protein product [Spirometra erinaceieuropaei]